MCGRFFIEYDFRPKLKELMKEENIIPLMQSAAGQDVVPSGSPAASEAAGQDVFPSDLSTVICDRGGVLSETRMHWGFSNPYRSGLIINARSETVREKKLFASSIWTRRCVIPASGFYEWDPFRARFRFTAPEGGLLLLAGIFHEEQGDLRYTILTTDANDSMRQVHDRMPLMVSQDEIRPWLQDERELDRFLGRPQAGLHREQDSGQIRLDLGV